MDVYMEYYMGLTLWSICELIKSCCGCNNKYNEDHIMIGKDDNNNNLLNKSVVAT